MLSPWVFHGTEMTVMIGTLRNVRQVLTDKNCKVNGDMARANLEVSPQRKPSGKAQPTFYKALSDARGDR